MTGSRLPSVAVVAAAAAWLAVAGLSGPALGQNPAALAEAAAKAAREQKALDTLVTPEAMRALRRLADSAHAASDAGNSGAQAIASKSPPQSKPQALARPAAQTVAAEAAEPVAPGTVTEVVVRESGERRELRLVASTALDAVLSEPFRTTEGARLYLTLAGASLTENAHGDVADIAKDGSIGTVTTTRRDDGVRLSIEVATLGAYGLDAAGDTTVLWLTQPHTALATDTDDAGSTLTGADAGTASADATGAAIAGMPAPPSAGVVARQGWAAFRRDVAAVLDAVSRAAVGVGRTVGSFAADLGGGLATGGERVWTRIATSDTVADALRILVLATLFLAPPAGVFILFRRARAGATEPRAAKAARAAKPGKPQVTRRTEDARLWAARTLAANGTDVAEIARQTGISREAAVLLVRRSRPTENG